MPPKTYSFFQTEPSKAVHKLELGPSFGSPEFAIQSYIQLGKKLVDYKKQLTEGKKPTIVIHCLGMDNDIETMSFLNHPVSFISSSLQNAQQNEIGRMRQAINQTIYLDEEDREQHKEATEATAIIQAVTQKLATSLQFKTINELLSQQSGTVDLWVINPALRNNPQLKELLTSKQTMAGSPCIMLSGVNSTLQAVIKNAEITYKTHLEQSAQEDAEIEETYAHVTKADAAAAEFDFKKRPTTLTTANGTVPIPTPSLPANTFLDAALDESDEEKRALHACSPKFGKQQKQ